MSHKRAWAGSDERRALMHMALDAVPNDLRRAVAQLWINAERNQGMGRRRLRRLLVVGPEPDFEVVKEVTVHTRYFEPIEEMLSSATALSKPHPHDINSEHFPKSPFAGLGRMTRSGYLLRPLHGFTGLDKTAEDLAKIGLCAAWPQELLSWVGSPLVHAAGIRAEIAAPGQHWNDGGCRRFVTVETKHMQVCLVPENYPRDLLIMAFHEKDIDEPAVID